MNKKVNYAYQYLSRTESKSLQKSSAGKHLSAYPPCLSVNSQRAYTRSRFSDTSQDHRSVSNPHIQAKRCKQDKVLCPFTDSEFQRVEIQPVSANF